MWTFFFHTGYNTLFTMPVCTVSCLDRMHVTWSYFYWKDTSTETVWRSHEVCKITDVTDSDYNTLTGMSQFTRFTIRIHSQCWVHDSVWRKKKKENWKENLLLKKKATYIFLFINLTIPFVKLCVLFLFILMCTCVQWCSQILLTAEKSTWVLKRRT